MHNNEGDSNEGLKLAIETNKVIVRFNSEDGETKCGPLCYKKDDEGRERT